MTRLIFIAFTIALVFDKSSNAFTIYQLEQTRQLHQPFQLNLNPEYESPFWFASFKEDDHSLDESSDFPSPFWFASFTGNDSSSEEHESSSFIPPQPALSSNPDSPSSFWFATREEDVSLSDKDESSSSTPTEPTLSSFTDLPDVNPTTYPETGFKFRDFALATRKIAEEGAKLVSNVHVNTTSIAAEAASAAESARAIAKEISAGLVAATSTLTETTGDAEKLKATKLAVALATAGGDIVKSVGALVKDAIVDSAIKPPDAAVVDASLEKPAPKEIIKVDAEPAKVISPELAKEKYNVVETFADDAEKETRKIIHNTPDAMPVLDLEASKPVEDDDLERTSSSNIANDQNDKELTKLSDKPVKESTNELEKLEESSIDETFTSDSNTETINNIQDITTAFDLEAPKPVEDDTLAKTTSVTNDQNDEELADLSDEPMKENTNESKISEESGVAETFMSDSESQTINNEELIGLSDEPVGKSTYELARIESDFANTFLSELETDTIDNIPDVTTVLDLETPKTADADVFIKTASIAKDQNDEEIIKVNEESVEENTNRIADVESVFDLEVSKPVEDDVLQRSTSLAKAVNDEEQRKLEGNSLGDNTQELEKEQTTLINGAQKETSYNYENIAGPEGGYGQAYGNYYGQAYGNYYDQENKNMPEENTILEADGLPSFHQLYEQRDNQRRTREDDADPYTTTENVYGGGYNYDYSNRNADYYDGSRNNNNVSDEIAEQQPIATDLVQDNNSRDGQLQPNPPATNFYSSTSSNTVTKDSFNNYDNVAATEGDSDLGYNDYYDDRANRNTKDLRAEDDGLPSFHDLYDRRMNGQ